MSQATNVEVVPQLWEAFSVGGVEATLPFVAPHVLTYPGSRSSLSITAPRGQLVACRPDPFRCS